jgi:hypothetical protein
VSSGGAYAVQVASECSAADAHASFRTLRAKFPNQLGGREPIVRLRAIGRFMFELSQIEYVPDTILPRR